LLEQAGLRIVGVDSQVQSHGFILTLVLRSGHAAANAKGDSHAHG